MNGLRQIARLLAALCLVVAFAGVAVAATAAAPTDRTLDVRGAFQDDDDAGDDDEDDDDDVGDDDDGTRGLPPNATGRPAQGDDDADDVIRVSPIPVIRKGTCASQASRNPTSGFLVTDDDRFEADDDEDDGGTAPVRGATTAILVHTAAAEFAVGLDDLLDGAHTIVVRNGDDATAAPIVCGDVGGVVSRNNTLVIGLAEHSASGYAGIAILSDEDRDDQVEVVCHLARGLVGGASDPAAVPIGDGDDDGDD